MALCKKLFILDIPVLWQLIYWSPKPSIKPFSCADWPASLQKRLKKKKSIWNQDLHLHLIKCFASSGRKKAHCHSDANSDLAHLHQTLLSPPSRPLALSPPSLSFFLPFFSTLPLFTFAKFWLLFGEIKLVWPVPIKLTKDKYWFYMYVYILYIKKKEDENARQRTERLLYPDSHESPCWQREASWQPQPEV